MGSETVIFILLAVIVILIILWRDEANEKKALVVACGKDLTIMQHEKEQSTSRIVELEAEIQRLRKIPLTTDHKQEDNSVIRARSAAQVRQITESSWGKAPEIGEANEND